MCICTGDLRVNCTMTQQQARSDATRPLSSSLSSVNRSTHLVRNHRGCKQRYAYRYRTWNNMHNVRLRIAENLYGTVLMQRMWEVQRLVFEGWLISAHSHNKISLKSRLGENINKYSVYEWQVIPSNESKMQIYGHLFSHSISEGRISIPAW